MSFLHRIFEWNINNSFENEFSYYLKKETVYSVFLVVNL